MRSWMIGLLTGILPVLLLPALPGPAVPALLAVAGLCLLRPGGRAGRFCSGLAFGCALALSHGQALVAHRLADSCVGVPVTATGEVASLPRSSEFARGRGRQRFEFVVHSLGPTRCRGPQRILLSYYGPAKMIPGQHWQFQLKLSRPWGRANPGSFNLQAWFAQTGIDAVGSVRTGGAIKLATVGGVRSLPDRQRQHISERIDALALPGDVAAVLAAITVADKSGIDAALWTLLQQFGINHLLVISGLHVGLVAGAGLLLGSLLQRLLQLPGYDTPWLPGLLALACASAYAALAGFSVATQRALCMLSCFILANLLGRNSGSANNLLLAAVVVLCLNPMAALGSGFWLSFAAVAALLWLSAWQSPRRRWQQLLVTHGFMSLAMVPLGAWWFGGSSLVAALANLVMVPLVGLVVVPLALLAVLAMYLLPAVETTLWRLAAWPLEMLLPVAKAVASAGGGWLYRGFSASPLEVSLAVLGVILLVLPGSLHSRALALLLVLPLVLPPDLAAAFPRADRAHGLTRVTVLDVGQGTAVIVRSAGQTLVYDTGGGDPAGANMASSVLLPYLRLAGESELDTVVISHPDNDHSAGVDTLLAAMPAGRVFYGGHLSRLSGGEPCRAGDTWHWPQGQQFRFLSPLRSGEHSRNDASCVLQIETAGHRLLLAGDIESDQERALVRHWGGELGSDWLLVAHHGSRTSSSHALLKTVRPAIAVISSGYANRFGHPHPDVVARLRQGGITVYNTAETGALEFEFAPGQALRVRRWREEVKRFWM